MQHPLTYYYSIFSFAHLNKRLYRLSSKILDDYRDLVENLTCSVLAERPRDEAAEFKQNHPEYYRYRDLYKESLGEFERDNAKMKREYTVRLPHCAALSTHSIVV